MGEVRRAKFDSGEVRLSPRLGGGEAERKYLLTTLLSYRILIPYVDFYRFDLKPFIFYSSICMYIYIHICICICIYIYVYLYGRVTQFGVSASGDEGEWVTILECQLEPH